MQVRLGSEEIAVVTTEHPTDPFRPQVKIIVSAEGEKLETPLLANTWERDDRGQYTYAVVEAVETTVQGTRIVGVPEIRAAGLQLSREVTRKTA